MSISPLYYLGVLADLGFAAAQRRPSACVMCIILGFVIGNCKKLHLCIKAFMFWVSDGPGTGVILLFMYDV